MLRDPIAVLGQFLTGKKKDRRCNQRRSGIGIEYGGEANLGEDTWGVDPDRRENSFAAGFCL